MSRVELRSVSRRYGAQQAVDAVTLVAEPGKFIALLGPSGCGKSTTLRLLAGLEPCDGGQVFIGGKNMTTAPPAQRGVAMVFQNYALFPHLSVAQNLVFGLTVRKVPAQERQRRLDRVCDLLGLSPYLDRKPSQLSGGQRQRVALGRAIVAEAPVCLMDEPLSNLDAQLRQQMRTEIRDLQQRLGMTMLYVTHDQTEAMTMADKVVLMRAGRVEQQGSPQDLYDLPQTRFVAGFIGAPAMNLFAGDWLPGGSSDVLLGVRPEQIRFDNSTPLVRAQVVATEYLGAETLVSCELTRGPQDDRLRMLVRTTGNTGVPQRGELVGLNWNPGAEHRFRQSDGLRLPEPTI